MNIQIFVFQKDIPQITYNLFGVISHLRQSGPSTHFFAGCKTPVEYNDAIVTPINNILKEVINFGTPYILFYQKNKELNNK